MDSRFDGEEELLLSRSDEVVVEAFLHLFIAAEQHGCKEGEDLPRDVVRRLGEMREDSEERVVRIEGVLNLNDHRQLPERRKPREEDGAEK